MENTQEQKTPEQWFQMLKEPYRSQAIANINKNYYSYNANPNSMESALFFSFDWEKSPEDHEYWDNVYKSINAGETTCFEPEALKPEPIELRPEDLVSGEVYTATDGTIKRTFIFTYFTNYVHYKKLIDYNGIFKKNGCLSRGFKFYHATPEEKNLLLGEETTDWEAKYNELKSKFDQLEPKGEKVYFYFNRDMEKIEIAKSLDEAKINSEECHPIYEAYCIGKKKSVLVNE